MSESKTDFFAIIDKKIIENNPRNNFVPVIFIGLLLGYGISDFFSHDKLILQNLKFAVTNQNIILAEESLNYKNLQKAVPPQEKILVALDKNFIFDFNRNEIWIADFPGGSSLPPGMPFRKGADTLSKYLLDHSIYYVAYSYKNEAGSALSQIQNRLDPKMNSWIRTEAEHTLDFHHNLEILGKSKKIIYDDGSHFVIDLRVDIKN